MEDKTKWPLDGIMNDFEASAKTDDCFHHGFIFLFLLFGFPGFYQSDIVNSFHHLKPKNTVYTFLNQGKQQNLKFQDYKNNRGIGGCRRDSNPFASITWCLTI